MNNDPRSKQKRIFEIAKELNISFKDIIEFLRKQGQECSMNTGVDEACYLKILEEFARDKDRIERIRKEKARKEAENKRKEEEEARRAAELERRKIEEEVYKAASLALIPAVRDVLEYGIDVKKHLIEAFRETEKKTEVAPKPTAAKKTAKAPEPEPLKVTPSAGTEHLKKKDKKKLKRIKIDELEPQLGIKTAKHRLGGAETDKTKFGRGRVDWHVTDKVVDEQIRKTMAKLGERGAKKKYKKTDVVTVEENVEKKIRVSEFATVETVAHLMNAEPADVIQICMKLGMITTMNQRLDFDTITLIADELGFKCEKLEQYGEELLKIENTEEDLKAARPRPPVVAIMGHVDHGKTTLLDFIRRSNIVGGESGGITQHIGAYKVELKDGKSITILDTPGHEAFTAMRARGAQVTDIVILIVAADDGVMPQTIEAISHAKAANVPIVVAINKIDKPEADPERVKRELANNDVLLESWGGKVQAAEISAKTGQGVSHLLDLILLEAEMLELKANFDSSGMGTVIEAKLDKKQGPVATVIIKKGTINIGDVFVCGASYGHVRSIVDERRQRLRSAGPSDSVQIAGFDILPKLADTFAIVEDEREARKIASERQKIEREHQKRQAKEWSLDAISAQIAEGKIKQLNVILKCDMDGSVEAISQSLGELVNEEVAVGVKHKATGNVVETDVLLAKASEAVIIGFNVTADAKVRELAKKENVEIRHYSIIYELIDDVKAALEGLLTPEKIEEMLGELEVRQLFKIPKAGVVAGSYVLSGKVTRNANVRVKRDGQVLFEGLVASLKRIKDDVREVQEGFECGVCLDGFNDFQVGDHIEFFEVKSKKRTLALK